MHVWSSAKYTFPLPNGHRFPIAKYALLRQRVIDEEIVPAEHVHDPSAALREDLLLVHTPDYVDRFTAGLELGLGLLGQDARIARPAERSRQRSARSTTASR